MPSVSSIKESHYGFHGNIFGIYAKVTAKFKGKTFTALS